MFKPRLPFHWVIATGVRWSVPLRTVRKGYSVGIFSTYLLLVHWGLRCSTGIAWVAVCDVGHPGLHRVYAQPVHIVVFNSTAGNQFVKDYGVALVCIPYGHVTNYCMHTKSSFRYSRHQW